VSSKGQNRQRRKSEALQKKVRHALGIEVRVYDPPGGWQYGFPKPYNPIPGESLNDTLARDGYPQREIAQWAKHDGSSVPCRFWTVKQEAS
jgi:hypothetical protein